MENKIMEEANQVYGGGSITGKGKLVGLLFGTVGVLGGIAAAVLYKKKKNSNNVEEAEVEVVENDESAIEE